MSLVTSLVVNDGSATPVAVTFSPIKKGGEVVVFADKRAETTNGWPTISTGLSYANPKRRTHRTKFDLAVPVTAVVDGEVTVLFTNRVQINFIVDERSSTQNCKDLFAFASNGINVAAVKAQVVDKDGIY